MRLLVYNTESKIFWKLFMHVDSQSAGPQNKQSSTQAVYLTTAQP